MCVPATCELLPLGRCIFKLFYSAWTEVTLACVQLPLLYISKFAALFKCVFV